MFCLQKNYFRREKMNGADLHIHSSISDGLLSPEEIVDWGLRKNLEAISITDHDSIAGIHNAGEYARGKGIEVVPGIELSTEYNSVEIHMLGYYIDYYNPALIAFITNLKESRLERAKKIVKKLNMMGYMINFNDICNNAQNVESIGRPHIARTLIEKGYCESTTEAFDKLLGFNRPAYVERYKVSPFEAIEIILKCDGAASIAHPGLIVNIDKLKLIAKLKKWGLAAIEVYHSSHTENDIEFFSNAAKSLDLIATGGSDCHGIMTDNIPALGSVTVPYENVRKLKLKSQK